MILNIVFAKKNIWPIHAWTWKNSSFENKSQKAGESL